MRLETPSGSRRAGTARRPYRTRPAGRRCPPYGLLLTAILFTAGCAPQAPIPADLEQIPHPPLDAIEEIARRQLEEQRSRLESGLAKGAGHRELADAFGGMGELYHAYELPAAAAACYRNAETLDPQSFLWPYYLGALHLAAGDLKAAAASLERALAIEGGDLPARRRLGEARLELGDAAAARDHFRRLLADERFAAAGHFGLARAAAAAGDGEQAVEHFEKTLELQPEAGIVHHPLGLALRQAGRPDEAQAHLAAKGTGEVLTPDRLMERIDSLAVTSGAHLRRGNRALMQGRLEVAEEELRRAVEVDPGASEARRNLALVLVRRGDAASAREELEAAARFDPRSVWIQVDLGNVFMALGLAEKAVGALERAVELDPTLAVARFNLAGALAGLERWDEARPHLEAVLRLEPGHRRARYLLAMVGHQAGDATVAARELRALLAEDPADLVVRRGLATVLATGQPEAAMAVYRQGLELDVAAAQKVELADALARLAWQRGLRQQAIAAWRQATEIDPSSSQAFTRLANALQLADEREEARGHFARAVELDPANATARLSEARLWILAGDFATARERLEAGVAAAPDHPGLLDTLARLLATCSIDALRDGRRALALARKAYGLANTVDHAETVGMALAELRQFEEAIRWQRGLIQNAAATGDRDAMRRLASSLRLYESRRPVRVAG